MNIRDLQYLVAVHDLNNFSKAAERCFVSQPTLSGQLKKLEEELGATLIERSTRQVLFTQLGEKIVDQARQLLATADNIRSIVSANDDPMAGEFHIGLIPTVGPFMLPLVMPSLSKQFPRARLFLHELQTKALLTKLAQGEIDAAVVAKDEWAQPVREIPLFREPMLLAVSTSDDLAQSEASLPLSVLHERDVLMLEDGHCLRDQALGVCFAAGAKKEDARFSATSMDTLLHMVANGVGITLVPKMATRKNIEGVKFIELEESQAARELVVLVRNNSARLGAIREFASAIQREVQNSAR